MSPFSKYEEDWQADFLHMVQQWQRHQLAHPNCPCSLFPDADHNLLERAQERAFAAVFGEKQPSPEPPPEEPIAPTVETLIPLVGTDSAGALDTLRRCVQEQGLPRYQEDMGWYTTLEQQRLAFLADLERQGKLG